MLRRSRRARHSGLGTLLTAGDVARLLNVHLNTVRRWNARGLLPAYRIGSRGDRRFRQEDLGEFLVQQVSKKGNHRGRANNHEEH